VDLQGIHGVFGLTVRKTPICQPYLLPLAGRLAETTVSNGGDAGCEGFANSVAEMRHTFPKR
jgi:hypothetical protein